MTGWTDEDTEREQLRLWTMRSWSGREESRPLEDLQNLAVYGHDKSCRIDCRHRFGMHCDCSCHAVVTQYQSKSA